MTCRARTPAPVSVPPAHPTADQYNVLLARLDTEVHLRTQLESQLHASREENSYLQHRLADLAAPPRSLPAAPAPPRPQLYRPASSAAESQDPTPMDRDVRMDKQENVIPAPDTKGHDKEILSHCSDISACKSTARTPDLKKSTHRKSSTNNLAALNGVTKKSKSKKDRQAKVKIPGQSRYWTSEEHKLFLEALNKYGHKDLRSISNYVGTRNMTQVRTHSQKYFMRLMREAKRQNPVGTRSSNVSGDEATPADDNEKGATSVAPRPASSASGVESCKPDAPSTTAKEADTGDKYSVPNTCGMTLLCLVGEDTLAA